MRKKLWIWQVVLLVAIFAFWHVATHPELIPPFVWDNPDRAAFFFGEPVKIFKVIVEWFAGGEIYPHLWVTLQETALAFVIGSVLGLVIGLWLGLTPFASALLDPYIKAMNAMPRVVLAPIFMVWFGLGIWSKVALGVTLVFFIVFFNVYQGVKEVSPVVLNNATMLGATRRQLLRYVYLPSATSWVFSSLHTAVGMAFVGAVVGEYLGSAKGVGYLIHMAEGSFDINTVFAGILVLTIFALVLDFAVSAAERRLLVWRPTQGETEQALSRPGELAREAHEPLRHRVRLACPGNESQGRRELRRILGFRVADLFVVDVPHRGRHHRDADPCGHQRHVGQHLVDFGDDLRREAHPPAGFDEVAIHPRRARPANEDERLVGEIAQPHPGDATLARPCRQRVPGGQRDQQRFRCHDVEGDAAVFRDGAPDEADVEPPRGHGLGHGGGVVLVDGQLDARVRFPVTPDQVRGEPVHHRRAGEAERKGARRSVRDLGSARDSALYGRDDRRRLLEEHGAPLGQLDAAGKAPEERVPQFALEIAHLL